MRGPSNSQFQGHYQNLFKQRQTQNATVLVVLSKELKSSEDFCRESNETEVRTTLGTLKSGKAPGKSSLPFSQKCIDASRSTRTQKSLLRKKMLKTDPNNYRSLFMLEDEEKLECKIIKNQSSTKNRSQTGQVWTQKRTKHSACNLGFERYHSKL